MPTEQVVVGVLDDYKEALRAVDELRGLGFGDDVISVVARHPDADTSEGTPAGTPEPEDAHSATKGAEAGAVIGAAGGLLAGLGALMIPGIGPILAAGPILGALGGAALGAATGGLVGVLVDLGVPEHEAREYEQRLHKGDVIVTVRTDDEHAPHASEVLRRYEALEARPPLG